MVYKFKILLDQEIMCVRFHMSVTILSIFATARRRKRSLKDRNYPVPSLTSAGKSQKTTGNICTYILLQFIIISFSSHIYGHETFYNKKYTVKKVFKDVLYFYNK